MASCRCREAHHTLTTPAQKHVPGGVAHNNEGGSCGGSYMPQVLGHQGAALPEHKLGAIAVGVWDDPPAPPQHPVTGFWEGLKNEALKAMRSGSSAAGLQQQSATLLPPLS